MWQSLITRKTPKQASPQSDTKKSMRDWKRGWKLERLKSAANLCRKKAVVCTVWMTVLLKRDISARTGLSCKLGSTCRFEICGTKYHSAIQLQNLRNQKGQNRHSTMTPWRQDTEGYCFLAPQHEATAPQVSLLSEHSRQTLLPLGIRACTQISVSEFWDLS